MSTDDVETILAGVPERFQRLMGVIGLASVGEFAAALGQLPEPGEDAFGMLEEGLRLFITELQATDEGRQQALAELQRANQDIEQKLSLIEAQRHEIRQLSTPVLDVWEGVLAAPIVGNLGHARAVEVTDALLQRIVATRARWALVDLTGVEDVDAGTADHLLKLAAAIKLVGCRCVITGVSPAVAQTLVSLDGAPRELHCLPNLREGLRHCLTARGGSAGRTVQPGA